MKLNKKGKEELRTFIEEQLENRIPNDSRIHLDKELLESLLFEIHMTKDKQLAKFLIWSGPFLSKIDLSEISFEDVVWNLQECETSSYGLFETNYYQNISSIDLSYTNAKIDFNQSYRMKQFDYEIVNGVKLEGVDLSHSNGECIKDFNNSNFKDTNILVQFHFNLNDLADQNNSWVCNTNFENVDLSNVEIPAWYFSEYLEEHGIYGGNFTNTGLKINTTIEPEDEADLKSGLKTIGELVQNEAFIHCYIDGTLMLSRKEKEEIKIQKLNAYQAFKEELFATTQKSIESQSKQVQKYYK